MDSALQLQKRIEILESRLAVNAEGGYRPTQFEYETEVPSVEDLRVVGTQVEGSWSGALTWVEPQNKDIAAYEIWARNVSSESSGWVKKGEVTQPPWSDTIVTDSNLTVQFSVRTKFRNGLGMTIENSPTVPVSILAPSVSITDPSQVGPNVIGDSAFIRSGGDRIQVVNADIVNLAATKITAGTLAAGVIYANAIAASQIQAGTISAAISLTSPNITSTSGAKTATLNAGVITAAGTVGTITLDNGNLNVVGTGARAVRIVPNSLSLTDTSLNIAAILQDTGSGNGQLILSNGGSATITLTGSTGTIAGTAVDVSGDVDFGDELRHNGSLIINSAGAFVGPGVDVGAGQGVAAAGFNITGGSHFGVTGPTTFTTVDGKTVTVRGGIITSIV